MGGVSNGMTELRASARSLMKAPAFAAPVVLLIALGVGGATTVFTLVDHVLLRPLPYPAADRLYEVGDGALSGPVGRELETTRAFDAWALASSGSASLTGLERPAQVERAFVTSGFFALFGAQPARGRLLSGDDFTGGDRVVLSHGAWQRLFAGDPDVVGRALRIDGRSVTVVGVVTDGFTPPRAITGARVDVWAPVDWSEDLYAAPDRGVFAAVGRLARGASPAEARRELEEVAERLAGRYPERRRDGEGNVRPLEMLGLQAATVERVRDGLSLLMGGVVVLLLVACLNVAHLFLARGVARRREIAVRRALGGGTPGLLRQLLGESLLVALAGGLLGLGLARVGLDLLERQEVATLPLQEMALDLRVVVFAAFVSTATAVVFGLLPGLRSLKGDLARDLRGGRGETATRATARLRRVLVVGEVALSMVLVALTGLLVRGYQEITQVDPGFDAERLWTLPLSPTASNSTLPYDAAMDRVIAALEAVPGVRSASWGWLVPFEMDEPCCWMNYGMVANGRARNDITVVQQPGDEGYFETLGIPFRTGGPWSEEETGRADEVPVVLSERLAVDFFGSAEAAQGRVVRWEQAGLAFRVSGVVADTRHFGLDEPEPHLMYVPASMGGYGFGGAHFVVRVGAMRPGLPDDLRRAVWDVLPSIPIPVVRPMDEWIARSTSGRRLTSVVFSAYGIVSLLLAAMGLYGTLLYSYRLNRKALGIRLALGASPSSIQTSTLGSGVRLALTGVGFGLAAAWLAGAMVATRIDGLDRGDPLALGGAAGVLVLSALLASWIPARQAARTDPRSSLEAE